MQPAGPDLGPVVPGRPLEPEGLGLLAGGIAHDLNNLLGVIRTCLDLARDELGDRHPAVLLAKAGAALQKSTALTGRLLAYSGCGQVQKRPVDLNATVLEITGLLAVNLPSTIQLEFELEPELAWPFADPVQVHQVVLNLVLNAAEAIGGDAGRIHIRTASTRIGGGLDARDLRGRSLAPGPYVLLEVLDTGCGMSEQMLERIFEPFYSTKPHGRGLGLAAMSGILEDHQGGLWIESSPGQGSKFRLCFPDRIPGLGDLLSRHPRP